MSKLAPSIAVGPFTLTDCSYDAGADVAYLSAGGPRPAISWESPEGHLVRIDPYTDELVGITLLWARKRIDSDGEITVTLPEHVLAAVEGCPAPGPHRPLTLPRAELAALCA
jgi:hypothetical protein